MVLLMILYCDSLAHCTDLETAESLVKSHQAFCIEKVKTHDTISFSSGTGLCLSCFKTRIFRNTE